MARLEAENRLIFAHEIGQLQSAARHEVATQLYTADRVSHRLQELLPGDDTMRPTSRQIMLVELATNKPVRRAPFVPVNMATLRAHLHRWAVRNLEV